MKTPTNSTPASSANAFGTIEVPETVNFHFWRPCNMRCKFCFATFEPEIAHAKRSLTQAQCEKVIDALGCAGVKKITFAGGEPTLCPWLETLVRRAKRAGMTTMLVTNGTDRLDWALAPDRPLDWLALSVDSLDSSTLVASGRSVGQKPLSAESYLELVSSMRSNGVRIKINTVVHRLNADEDLSAFILAANPERWKVLQVLPVLDQNTQAIGDLEISPTLFQTFVDRHRMVVSTGIRIVPETNEDIRGSYAMLDPLGRFFDSSAGSHHYGPSVLDVGVKQAWASVTFSNEKFLSRGGQYDFANKTPLVQLRSRAVATKAKPKLIAFAGPSGSGKDTAAEPFIEKGYKRIAIIDPLKLAIQRSYNLSHAQLWGDLRNETIAPLGVTPRQLLQMVSAPIRELEPDFWIRRWSKLVEETISEGHSIVCTDIRTLAEVEAAQALGGLVLRIDRPGARAPGRLSQDQTESEILRLPGTTFNHIIDNSGGLDDLHRRVREALGIG
jgi:radical S-adenosyl methionine domain-containing protein 2